MTEKASTPISAGGFEYGVKHFYNQDAGLLTEILFSALNLEFAEAENLLTLGAVYVGNRRQLKDAAIEPHQLCRVHTKPRRYNCDHNWTELIVFENRDFLVLNKPSGVPSHPSVDNFIENALTQTARARNTELLITHRLDTLTSGIIVYAKNTAFVKHFNQQLQERNIEKRYSALVETTRELPKNLIHYMEPSPRAPKKISATFHEGWSFCELEILEQERKNSVSWVKINLLTGRTHQIRSQMSDIGAPILGDVLYGAKLAYRPEAIALKSCELRFNWGSERMTFTINEEFE